MSYLTPLDAANASICFDPRDDDGDDPPRRVVDRDGDRDRCDPRDREVGANRPWENRLDQMEDLRQRFGRFENYRDRDDRCRDADGDRGRAERFGGDAALVDPSRTPLPRL